MSGKGQVGSKRKLLTQWLPLASALYPKVLWHSLKVDEGRGEFLALEAILHGNFLGGMDFGWPASRLGLRGRFSHSAREPGLCVTSSFSDRPRVLQAFRCSQPVMQQPLAAARDTELFRGDK